MPKVTGVSFHLQDKIYDFASPDFDLKEGDIVIVDTEQGTESGRVRYHNKEKSSAEIGSSLKPILRKATLVDLKRLNISEDKKTEAIGTCRVKVKKYQLPMKLVDVQYSFDGSRITFYFTAEERIDFRDLVKDLTRTFQKSIRLQQVGSRDVAGKIGGYGICGRELCCKCFMKSFVSITTNMARAQQMANRGSERISGTCGRLMCCLSHEYEAYKEMGKNMPELGRYVTTKKGSGRVITRNVLKQVVEVEYKNKEKELLNISEVNIKNV